MPADSELHSFMLFGTAIGGCALVWNDHGIAHQPMAVPKSEKLWSSLSAGMVTRMLHA